MRIHSAALCLVAVVMSFACGKHGGDDSGAADAGGPLAGLIKILVTPADETLMNSGTTAATETYVAMGEFADGHMADITALVEFSLDDASVGSFPATGGAFTSAIGKGGHTNVNAMGNGLTGSTTVTVQMVQSWNDPASTTLPTDPGSLFTGSAGSAARNPALVYPNDGVVVPPNLGRLEFHFYPGTSNTVFELTFKNTVLDVTVYMQCTDKVNSGCIYLPDTQLWSWLSETARGGDPVTWSIRGTDTTGTAVGASSSMALSFAPDDLGGGIYYWTTTAEAVMRWDFASTTQTTPQVFINGTLNDGCIGCHALSHDGKKLVAESGGQRGGSTALLDVASTTALNTFGSGTKTNFESWNPDGSEYVGVWADNADYDGSTNYNLKLLSGSNGSLVSTINVNGTAANPSNHPDWSYDGSRIAFDRVGLPNTLQESWNDSIWIVTQSGGTWGAPVQLVPAEPLTNHYYPAFAPDGRLLVYDISQCTSGSAKGGECDGDTDPTATLWAIDSIAGTGAIEMTNANKPGIADGSNTALTDSFPKWNPFVSRKTNGGGHLAWVTFSSQRQFGLRNPGSNTWLWMAAVDLDAPAGTDPSSVAFALPFQDLTTSNHIAQWTEVVVPPISSEHPTGQTRGGVRATQIRATSAPQ